jgi:hypothetical protein
VILLVVTLWFTLPPAKSTPGRQWKVAAYFGFQRSEAQTWSHEIGSGGAS